MENMILALLINAFHAFMAVAYKFVPSARARAKSKCEGCRNAQHLRKLRSGKTRIFCGRYRVCLPLQYVVVQCSGHVPDEEKAIA